MKIVICLSVAILCIALADCGKSSPSPSRKGRVHSTANEDAGSSGATKLSPASSRQLHHPSILEDPEYNMVSLDGHQVAYIAANRLYYHRIPHQKLVLQHEDIRELNGLPRHLLESIRPFFPFFVDY